jgi:SagB-type dehydrogenase family enzyme
VTPVVARQTIPLLEAVYGGRPALDDPAEVYHEASKLTPAQIERQLEGTRRLASSADLQLSSTRAVRRHGAGGPALARAAPLSASLESVIAGRRSRRAFGSEPMGLDRLAALLHAAYGVTGALESEEHGLAYPVRTVPSGGALYPLEVYVATLRVVGLEPGLYHFDPLAPGLETRRLGLLAEELAELSTHAEIVSSCAVLFFVAAIFGRTRFKYGLRGYRFALLEAGHLGQNVLLAAGALGLAAVPLGGFYDRPTDTFLELDGVNESTLYTLAIGPEAS